MSVKPAPAPFFFELSVSSTKVPLVIEELQINKETIQTEEEYIKIRKTICDILSSKLIDSGILQSKVVEGNIQFYIKYFKK